MVAARPGHGPAPVERGEQAAVLCFVPQLDRSGAPTSALLLLSRLRASYPAAALVAEAGPLAAEYERAGVPVHPLGAPGWRYGRWRRRLDGWLASPGIRGLHINNLCPEGVPLARAARWHGVPVLWHIREDPHSTRARRLRDAALRLSSGIVTVSEEIRLGLFPGQDDPPVVTIHNGAPDRAAAASPGAGRLRGSRGWGAECVVIGLLGRLVPRKGVREFLLAARVLVAEDPRARFLLAGRWDTASRGGRRFTREMQDLVRAPALAGKVAWVGETDSPLGAIEECDIVAVPSWWEGSSRVLLEAMACARAVVASAVGGNPEIVENGASGLLVPPRDAQALVAPLRALSADSGARERLGRAARFRAETHFSLAAHCARMEAFYGRVFRPRRIGALAAPGVA